jgi:crotonobetaine/carnitine-CoA ligase
MLSRIGEIVKFSEENLGGFKLPRYIELRESLPKTPSERVQKEKLKKEKADLTEGCFDRLAPRKE